MRHKKAPKRIISPDSIYGSITVGKLINKVMRDGEKSVAAKQVYNAFGIIAEKTSQDPLMVFKTALENVKPIMEIRARRIGGAAYQVPMPVRVDRKVSLALRWIVENANAKPNGEFKSFAAKLAAELMDAANNTGASVKQRDTVHRQAEANQAFAHFRW